MTTMIEIPPAKAPELVKHLNEVINAIQDVNDGLVARLRALPDCPPEVLLLLKEWTKVIDDVHTASDLFVVKLSGGLGPIQ